MALVLPLGPLWPALLRGGRSAGDTELCPTQAHQGWGAELRFGGATASLPAVSSPGLWVGLRWVPGAGPCVPGRVQSWGVRCEHSRGTALSARGRLRQTLRSGEGGTAEHRPLCPQRPPRPYHTSQCLPGFMGEPRGQPKCSTKSRELLRVPITRYLSGLWGSVTSPSWELSGVRTEHQT